MEWPVLKNGRVRSWQGKIRRWLHDGVNFFPQRVYVLILILERTNMIGILIPTSKQAGA